MKQSNSAMTHFPQSPLFSAPKKPEIRSVLLSFKDPGSAITHLIAFVLTLLASIPLWICAKQTNDMTSLLSMIIFSFSMMALYAASTCYHSFDTTPKANRVRKKIDHMMIFILIAGSYTPICLLALPTPTSAILLAAVWSIAFLGCILKLCWIYCPKWVSSVLYIAMGWTYLFALPQLLQSLHTAQFIWLLAGGIIYTIGGVIYALKLPLFNSLHPHFGSHEIFHLFVMGGSLCHFVVMFLLL